MRSTSSLESLIKVLNLTEADIWSMDEAGVQHGVASNTSSSTLYQIAREKDMTPANTKTVYAARGIWPFTGLAALC
ncbi:hypothetical protein A4X13_0g8414 [Tilletia indica]|uniref:Uncharacterized protein n=1 Tax=Tilletia indica TaxID=43049 RepID=A0A8T8SF02_9BASI|nr:hypothetical protein A4X13_0g8414 [Tilletia indica]